MTIQVDHGLFLDCLSHVERGKNKFLDVGPNPRVRPPVLSSDGAYPTSSEATFGVGLALIIRCASPVGCCLKETAESIVGTEISAPSTFWVFQMASYARDHPAYEYHSHSPGPAALRCIVGLESVPEPKPATFIVSFSPRSALLDRRCCSVARHLIRMRTGCLVRYSALMRRHQKPKAAIDHPTPGRRKLPNG